MEVILYAQCVSFWAISLIYNTWHCPHRLRRSCSTRQWQTLFQTEWRALIMSTPVSFSTAAVRSRSVMVTARVMCGGRSLAHCSSWASPQLTWVLLLTLSIPYDHIFWSASSRITRVKAQIISNCPEREVSSLTEGHCSDRSHRRVSCPDTWSHPQQWGSSDSHSGYERRHLSAFESREYC